MTKAGRRGTMVHSLADVLKQLGVSAFNRRGRLPLYGPQSIVCFPLRQQRWFSARGWTYYHVVAFSPSASSLHQLNRLCG